MKHNKYVIITGGECKCDRIDPKIAADAFVIAADSGLDTARKLDISPDMIVGDMDSVTRASLDEAYGKKILVSPPEKDDTDTMLAISQAEKMGAENIVIVGGGGGRADHWLSNIFMLESLASRGITAEMVDGINRIRVVEDGEYVIRSNGYFGLLALEDSVVSVVGCKYPLTNAILTRRRPYAVSNEVSEAAGNRAIVTVRGAIVITESEK